MCYRNLRNGRGNGLMKTLPISSNRGIAIKPIRGAGALLLSNLNITARPPFLGKEEVVPNVFYKGSGITEMDKLNSKLDKLNLVKPAKNIRKNIKISF
jgi:hypothetical protein